MGCLREDVEVWGVGEIHDPQSLRCPLGTSVQEFEGNEGLKWLHTCVWMVAQGRVPKASAFGVKATETQSSPSAEGKETCRLEGSCWAR